MASSASNVLAIFLHLAADEEMPDPCTARREPRRSAMNLFLPCADLRWMAGPAVTGLVILRAIAGSTLANAVATGVDFATARGMTWIDQWHRVDRARRVSRLAPGNGAPQCSGASARLMSATISSSLLSE